MAIEPFSFDKGMNTRKSPLVLSEGEVQSVTGFSYLRDGMMETRQARTRGYAIDSTSTSKINHIHRYGDNIYASSRALCPGGQAYFNYIYHRDIADTSYTNIDLFSGNIRPVMLDYEKFTFIVDGESKRACLDEKDYVWGVENPKVAPTVVVGAAGVPNTTYYCAYTYLVTFPNGKIVETAPSPVGTVVATLDKIEWSGIIPCTYQGTGLQIQKRLWRSVSGVYYLSATIENETLTYSDNETDANLQVATVLPTEEYNTPPNGMVDLALYLQRVFGIWDNRLGWSEPYQPFSFLTNSNVVFSRDNENGVGVINWGDQLFMVTKEEWYRLSGSDPNTWAIKRTFTDNGVINRYTIKKFRHGILGLWNDGIYQFDGNITRNVTNKILGTKFFTDLDDLSVCYAEMVGLQYFFNYASTGTTVDSCIVIDFAYYPDIRIFKNNFIADADELYKQTNTRYLAKAGYEYTEGGRETIPVEILTGAKAMGAIIKRKCLDYLYYELDSAGKNVYVTIYADNKEVQTLTLNEKVSVRKRSEKLVPAEGYSFSIKIEASDAQDVIISSPWALEATPVGE